MAATMKAWQYSSSSGALEKTIHLVPNATKPTLNPTKPEMLVQVTSMSLNPADYKLAEMGFLGNIVMSKPASPGMDFSGRVVTLGQETDVFKIGDVVFGRLEPTQFGTLGQFVVAASCGGVGTAGLTAYQTIVPNVKAGDRAFINGGSGSVGVFGIQIAKALCKLYGADEAIDYTTTDVTQKLIENGLAYSLVVDNVGTSPTDLYTSADKFLLPAGKFVQVGGSASLETAKVYMSRLFLPRILEGGSRKFEAFFTRNSRDDLERIAGWIIDGKVKVPVEQVFEYGDVPKAIELLKGGKSKGKIIVHVADK
ncbi:zinc-binding dehydrogenase-domain-containing protein [Leptodontidium sp. MPI-SDFR-AT-0119]|nr:zinc-binding dehydrogenase-domain-containing protein [Leptodontidium sp. MPI-SDFR-AT-0119]